MEIPEAALSEVRNARQIPGEPRRRWFFSHEMDLIVWLDGEERPVSFQLAYDKHRRIERVIRWNPARGYTHHRVDDGLTGTDDMGPSSAGSALLVPDDAFDATRVRSRFLALSPTIPWVITQYVADRLRAHPGHRWMTSVRAALALAAIVGIPLGVFLACLGPTRVRSRKRRD